MGRPRAQANHITRYQNEITTEGKAQQVRAASGEGYNGSEGVPVGVGVGVAVDVGVGVGRRGVGVGEGGAEDVADGDGFALVGEAETEGGATGGGALVTAGAPVAGDRLGDVAPADPGLVVTEAAAEPGGWPLPDRAASARCGVCEPPSASTVMIPVATIAIRTPTAAATPDSASHRCLIGCGKPLGRNEPAPCSTSSRYDCASGPTSAHSPSTSSRSTSGSGASGAMPYSVARRSAPCMRSVQTSHWSMWRLTRLRVSAVTAVPVLEQQVELRAGPAPGAGHEQGAERLLQLATGARRQGVRLVPRHAEHGRQVGAVQVVPEVKLDDLAVARAQPVEGGPDEPAQFGLLRAVAGVAGRVNQVDLVARSRVALVAGYRVEPGPQLARSPRPPSRASAMTNVS